MNILSDTICLVCGIWLGIWLGALVIRKDQKAEPIEPEKLMEGIGDP
jgi:hypothetical protein